MTEWEYGIPHITTLYNTRHEAVGVAAKIGRTRHQGPLHWTRMVGAFNPKDD